ncbi:hypothetical protein [Sphingomonas montanisoli]|uniref:Uncharacterized protein n=1 Tax=Sphingomonas montanisoli TaxID=2606412 RepID=A0A5D9BZR1_9SPHN|nr:hypothetical protein [Sphingomonas montanisoli]TZG24934.1 hypothetical protein FYJ91_16790 [Sphingomonas montanisoli]
MDDDVTLDFELVIETLRSNIAAYTTASVGARRYRFYAFCRHEEFRRRKLLKLADADVMPLPIPVTRRLGLAFQRIMTGMRIRGSEERASIAELRHADIMLGELINRLLDRCATLPYVHSWLVGLKDVLDDAEQQMDAIEHLNRPMAHAMAA